MDGVHAGSFGGGHVVAGCLDSVFDDLAVASYLPVVDVDAWYPVLVPDDLVVRCLAKVGGRERCTVSYGSRSLGRCRCWCRSWARGGWLSRRRNLKLGTSRTEVRLAWASVECNHVVGVARCIGGQGVTGRGRNRRDVLVVGIDVPATNVDFVCGLVPKQQSLVAVCSKVVWGKWRALDRSGRRWREHGDQSEERQDRNNE